MDWITELVRDDPFFETALLLLVASAMGLVARLLRQPLIVMLIAVGIIVGPSVLDWVRSGPQLELLANLGIAVLLFVVGLKLDIHLIRRMGRVALATGLGQVAFTSLVGFLIALALGWSILASTYIAVALTFSSTIIIVKLLSDKRELEELHGRIAVGFLIVQDIVVVIVMIALSALGAGTAGEESSFWWQIGMVAIRGVLFLGAIALITLYVLPRLVDWVAGTPELLILLALSWGVGLAAVADLLGLSTEGGAFLGGVAGVDTLSRSHRWTAYNGPGLSAALLLCPPARKGQTTALRDPARGSIPVPAPHPRCADCHGGHGLHGLPPGHGV